MAMNKPVAWMGLTAHNQNRVSIEKLANDDIPLYAHPVKELTDEEIKQIWYDLYPLSSSSYWDDKREGLAELKFAKAILRKAQEK